MLWSSLAGPAALTTTLEQHSSEIRFIKETLDWKKKIYRPPYEMKEGEKCER